MLREFAKRYQSQRRRGFRFPLSGSTNAPGGSREEASSRLTPSSIVYWSRLGLAILAASVYSILGLEVQGNWGVELGTAAAVGLGVGFYVVSIYFYKYVLGYGEAELKGPRKIVTM